MKKYYLCSEMKQLVIFGNTYQRGEVDPVLSLL